VNNIDMRNTPDFFCMLLACALIKKLKSGDAVQICSNDRSFFSDLRRIHPECGFQLLSSGRVFEKDGDYIFEIRKIAPQARPSLTAMSRRTS